MIALALALALPCSKPLIEPQAGHGLFTHIRRLKDVCLPEISRFENQEQIADTQEPQILTSRDAGEVFAPPPVVSAFMLPPEGMWTVPYNEPYCACIAETHGQSSGQWAPFVPVYVGGTYSAPIAYPNIPAVPEPAEWALMLAGLGLLWRRKC